MMYGTGFADPGYARRITRLAESIKLPERRRLSSSPLPNRSGPVLVRGRGLARRRPRSPLSSLIATLFVVAALLLLLFG